MDTMKKTMFWLGSVAWALTAACSGGGGDAAEIEQLRNEAIAVHDEIMPQISAFDRNTIKIDSLLANLPQLRATNPDLDTTQVRSELTALKGRLEGATDTMMDWMTEFKVDLEDQTNVAAKAYYAEEIRKVTEMKRLFEDVSKESADKLAQF